jgi:hypothetical protein
MPLAVVAATKARRRFISASFKLIRGLLQSLPAKWQADGVQSLCSQPIHFLRGVSIVGMRAGRLFWPNSAPARLTPAYLTGNEGDVQTA